MFCLGSKRDSRISKMTRPWDFYWRKVYTQKTTSPKRRMCILQAPELEEQGWRSGITEVLCILEHSNMNPKFQRDEGFGVCPSECCWSCFGAIFLCCSPILPLGMGMFTLGHCLLKLCNLVFRFFFFFYVRRTENKEIIWVTEDFVLWTFEQCWYTGSLEDF